MRPIRQNLGPDASLASQPDKRDTTTARSSLLNPPGSRSTGSARLEDIVGVDPITISPLAPTKPDQTLWWELRTRIASANNTHDAVAVIHKTIQNLVSTQAVRFLSDELLTQADESQQDEQLHSLTVACRQALQSNRTQLRSTPDGKALVICTPCGRAGGCLAIVSDQQTERRPLCELIEFAAVCLSEKAAVTLEVEAHGSARHTAALIDLIGRISSEVTTESAAQCLAESLKKYLNAEQVIVGLSTGDGNDCQLTAISGQREIDRLTEQSRIIEAALQESVIRESTAHWPTDGVSTRHALRCHDQLANAVNADRLVSCPLPVEDGNFAGAVIVCLPTECETADTTGTFLNAACVPIAKAILAVHRNSQSVISRITQSVLMTFRSRLAGTMAAVLAVTTAILLIPVDYEVDCHSELQPVSRRFVAAPFDAPLHRCLVEPGDVVETGQVLAELDGRELRWELAGIQADLGKATREHDAFLSEQEFGRAAIAQHEMQRLQHRAALLSSRTRSLEIRSPIDGVVVAGELKDSEGVPLETGDSLFEVAPLDAMLVEVSIPDDDIRFVTDGQTVKLTLDAMPSETLDARITRVHPKAELREHENVFIAEAEISEPASWLRPGMRGEAAVSTGARTLGWNLFHKPIAHVRGWLRW